VKFSRSGQSMSFILAAATLWAAEKSGFILPSPGNLWTPSPLQTNKSNDKSRAKSGAPLAFVVHRGTDEPKPVHHTSDCPLGVSAPRHSPRDRESLSLACCFARRRLCLHPVFMIIRQSDSIIRQAGSGDCSVYENQ